MSCGIIYSAVGERYVGEAMRSARSSLKYNHNIEHIIFCDDAPPAPNDVRITRIARSDNPYSDKIRSMLQTPFYRTLYLDTDTYVCGRLSGLFTLLDRFDIAVAHTHGYAECGDPAVPRCFYEFNTGVLVFRRTPAVEAFLDYWLATYETWVAAPPFPRAGKIKGAADQPAFRHCLWESDLRVCVLPHEYNYRPGRPGRLLKPVRIIHGRPASFEAVREKLNATTGPRVFGRLGGLKTQGTSP